MACAPVSLPSKRCKAASAIIALLALCSICIGPAFAADQPRPTILLFPIESHWLSAPMARQVTAALAEQFSKQGLNVIVFDPTSAVFRDALPGPDVPATSMRHDLALAAGAQVSVVGQLSETDTKVELHLDLAGAVSHRSVSLGGVADQRGVGRETAVPFYTTDTVPALPFSRVIPPLEARFWEAIGADEAGQRAGAAERFADGQAALAAGDYPRAAREFEAATIGDPNRGDYFAGAAEAQAALGHYDRALIRYRRASSLLPKDRSIALRAGDIALLAGRPEQADAIFRDLYARNASDADALEGMARAARARGDFARAEAYYREVLTNMGRYIPPGQVTAYIAPIDTAGPTQVVTYEAGSNVLLPGILAHLPDDTIRLTSVPPDEFGRPIGMVYLKAGKFEEGVKVLLAYYGLPRGLGERAAWSDADYLSLSAALDEGSRTIAHDVQSQLSASLADQTDAEQTASALGNLHTLSDNLATVAEKIQVSPALDPAHRYRVLAYNLLNESNFEAGLYAGTRDPERRRRADLLADAYRKALDQAKELAAALLGGGGNP